MMQLVHTEQGKPILRVITVTVGMVGESRSSALMSTMRDMYINGFTKEQLTRMKLDVLNGTDTVDSS